MTSDGSSRMARADGEGATRRGGQVSAATRREDDAGGQEPTRRETGGASGATRREAVSADVGGQVQRIVLPASVSDRYEFVRDLPVSGGEADIAVLRDRHSGAEVIFKYYRHGITPDVLAMEKLRRADRNFVVELIDFHSGRDGAWEIQEYCAAGALSDWVAQRGGKLTPDTLKSVVQEIADALIYLHGPGAGIAHHDLKPSNVLVRTVEPLDLVLADFGLAKADAGMTHLTTTIKGSWHYAAPEVHSAVSTPRSDWFSLGAMVYEFYTGRRLFCMADGTEVSDADARVRCVDRNYSTERVSDPRWRLLCDGLLTWERDKRWSAPQVQAWLRGESPEVHLSAPKGESVSSRKRGYRPNWSPDLVATPAQLADQLRRHWDAAATELAGRPDARMIEFMEGLGGLKEAVRVVSSSEPPGSKLVRLQGLLDPDGSIVYEGTALDEASIARRIDAGDKGDESALDWLQALLNERILTAYAEVTGSDQAAKADYLLSRWKKQAEAVTKPLPTPYQAVAREAFRASLPELFAAALGRARGET